MPLLRSCAGACRAVRRGLVALLLAGLGLAPRAAAQPTPELSAQKPPVQEFSAQGPTYAQRHWTIEEGLPVEGRYSQGGGA
jgi:hypothetical protein